MDFVNDHIFFVNYTKNFVNDIRYTIIIQNLFLYEYHQIFKEHFLTSLSRIRGCPD